MPPSPVPRCPIGIRSTGTVKALLRTWRPNYFVIRFMLSWTWLTSSWGRSSDGSSYGFGVENAAWSVALLAHSELYDMGSYTAAKYATARSYHEKHEWSTRPGAHDPSANSHSTTAYALITSVQHYWKLYHSGIKHKSVQRTQLPSPRPTSCTLAGADASSVSMASTWTRYDIEHRPPDVGGHHDGDQQVHVDHGPLGRSCAHEVDQADVRLIVDGNGSLVTARHYISWRLAFMRPHFISHNSLSAAPAEISHLGPPADVILLQGTQLKRQELSHPGPDPYPVAVMLQGTQLAKQEPRLPTPDPPHGHHPAPEAQRRRAPRRATVRRASGSAMARQLEPQGRLILASTVARLATIAHVPLRIRFTRGAAIASAALEVVPLSIRSTRGAALASLPVLQLSSGGEPTAVSPGRPSISPEQSHPTG